MKVLITGSAGFIGNYLVQELINKGYLVVGIDNLSKSEILKEDWSYYENPRFKFVSGDAKNVELMKSLIEDCDFLIANAAKVGGISYFHKYPYDIIRENELLARSAFDAAIWAYKKRKLKRIIVVSSSMIYESATNFPTKEGDEFKIPPPLSVYGFQKLCLHYWCKAAYEQFGLPYTIVVPFNAIGIGEMPNNDGLHVIPDLIFKILNLKKGEPLTILGDGNQIRHYTYAADIAKGIRMILEKIEFSEYYKSDDNTLNESFHLASPIGHTVLEVAKMIWNKMRKDEFKFRSEKPFRYDVKIRVPDINKTKKIIGFIATTKLEDVLDHIIDWYVLKFKEKDYEKRTF